MTKPLVNIVVVTYNQYAFTETCLESLLKCEYENKKIFLVDNGSDKDSYKAFSKKYKRLKNVILIRSPKNLGFGGGCNLALKQITEGYIVFLNNDTTVKSNWLTPVIDYMEDNPFVGACQPKILDLNRPEYFEYAGAAGGFMDVFGYPFSRGRIFFTVEKDNGQYDNIVDLVWCSGTAFVTKKEVLDKIGAFDEIFFMYGEESDLCWRMNHAGYRLTFIPNSLVYHFGMGTMKKNPSYKKIFFLHRNGLILLLKNYSFWQLLKYLPIRILLDFVNFFYYFIQHPTNLNCFALFMSYGSVIYRLPQILKKHFQIRHFKKQHKQKYRYPIYRGSIVFDYFVKRKKKYSDIFPDKT